MTAPPLVGCVVWSLFHTSVVMFHTSVVMFTHDWSCFIHQLSCFIHQLSCFIHQLSCFTHHWSCFTYDWSCFIHQLSCFIHQLSCFTHDWSCFAYDWPCFIHHVSCVRVFQTLEWQVQHSDRKLSALDEQMSIAEQTHQEQIRNLLRTIQVQTGVELFIFYSIQTSICVHYFHVIASHGLIEHYKINMV